MAQRALSVVEGGSSVPRPRRRALSVKAAAASGDRRRLLVALRDKIAEDITSGVPPRDLASLSRRLLEIAREIEAIDDQDQEDDIGQAAATPDERWSAR